jgi:hypothetical protein
MILSIFKKINFLNWQNLENLEEIEKEENEDFYENGLLRVFFLQLGSIKLYRSVSFFINTNNHNSYFLFLKLRYNFISNVTFLLGHFEKNKFQWTNFNYIPYKIFTRLKSPFTIGYFFKKNISKYSKLQNIIAFKKKSGFLKKKTKLKNFLLLRLNNLKNFRLFNSLTKKNKFLKNNMNIFNSRLFSVKTTHHHDINKFIDLKKKWYKIFINNRTLLKSFLNIKKNKQFQLNKTFYKLIKRDIKVNVLKSEFSLSNILIRSKFILTQTEANFFLKNNFIFVNGLCITNPHYTIQLNDVVNIIFFKNYFFFFKTNFNQKLRLTYALGYRLWRLNRFKNNFYKQSPTGIPEWVYKVSFFYEDVPSFIEVDYLTLSLAIVCLPYKFQDFNYFFTKFLNLYLLRLYNWKYII